MQGAPRFHIKSFTVFNLHKWLALWFSTTLLIKLTNWTSKPLSKQSIKNLDLRNLSNWLNANKISLNVSEAKLVTFELKMKLNRKKRYQNDSVIYLGTHIDKTLIWKHHIINVAIKLSKANTRLFKIRHYINMKTLKQLFMQFLNHTYLMLLGRKIHHQLKDYILYKKSLRPMYFLNRYQKQPFADVPQL